jgi:hypothetical protein
MNYSALGCLKYFELGEVFFNIIGCIIRSVFLNSCLSDL